MALTLYAESTWMSPWVFHAMVALEEKLLPYKLEVVSLPMSAERKAELQQASVLGKVPMLVDDGVCVSESLAISEYLAERYPHPDHPRLFPEDLGERARARQIMSWLRTSLFALREDRPTSGVFGRPTSRPLSDKGRADAAELVRVARAVVRPGRTTMFDAWCIADTDLALCLMRMIAGQDSMQQDLIDYALAQFDRKSVRKYMAHLTTSP
jgi:glutathione S-transferase